MTPDEIELYGEIGLRVQGLRQTAGLKQQELADAASISRSGVANLETGRQAVPLIKLQYIATKLGVRLSMLMPGAPLEGRALELKRKYEALIKAKAEVARLARELGEARDELDGAS